MTERAICLGIRTDAGHQTLVEAEQSLDELAELARAAGAVVISGFIQSRAAPDPATYVGSGRLAEVRQLAEASEVNLLIFDDELSGSQIRNISQAVDCRVIDRTMLILDIFARRARSKEGKLQVELAQLQYRLSHLTGQGQAMSRLGGGIGTRGPGESQLETDRRHIRRRIHELKKSLEKVSQGRSRMRQRRQEQGILTIAVVGYTNAGKSTLINQLCQTDLLAADQVFATLDPSVRRLVLPDQSTVLLIDTVGFIRKLPHHLVEAFQATLDEVRQADAVLQVIDAADPDADRHLEVVELLLERLDSAGKERVVVINKADLLEDLQKQDFAGNGHLAAGKEQVERLHQLLLTVNLMQSRHQQKPAILVSAATGQGSGELLQAITDLNLVRQVAVKLLIPYQEARWLDYVRRQGRIDAITYLDQGIEVTAHIPWRHIHSLQAFIELAQHQ